MIVIGRDKVPVRVLRSSHLRIISIRHLKHNQLTFTGFNPHQNSLLDVGLTKVRIMRTSVNLDLVPTWLFRQGIVWS